jgi:hypothetical protein
MESSVSLSVRTSLVWQWAQIAVRHEREALQSRAHRRASGRPLDCEGPLPRLRARWDPQDRDPSVRRIFLQFRLGFVVVSLAYEPRWAAWGEPPARSAPSDPSVPYRRPRTAWLSGNGWTAVSSLWGRFRSLLAFPKPIRG